VFTESAEWTYLAVDEVCTPVVCSPVVVSVSVTHSHRPSQLLLTWPILSQIVAKKRAVNLGEQQRGKPSWRTQTR